ncbi:transmembrane channel-like protein 7 isoform X2 [Syngnathoides biaculeatus]|uniref:transmembrane channel-like protein 7 isoform X2 n=1 Tax=Syngnathoides biaculeatus TaxID=300417 RepID=UPI002ADD4C24|nr:transmembrane channel-like protein 7 isoform X2 [Syngnathoides biaculeatus]
MDPHRQGSSDHVDDYAEYIYSSGQESLRLRRPSSRGSNRNYPHFNWNPAATEVHREEEDYDEVEGYREAEQELRDLRTIPLPMTLKRAVRQVQEMQVPVPSSRMSSWRQRNRKTLQKIKNNATEFLRLFMLWRKSLQQIGGNFGGGVQSYFLFLRFLVVLNFVSFLLIAGFVFIPSIVFRSATSGLVNNTGPEECLKYDPNPHILVAFYTYVLDFLSGTGFMEYSYMFYGYYSNMLVGDNNFSYNLPLAYMSTAVFYFAFCLICIMARMGMAARVAVATGGSAVGDYSLIVFTGWDYGCLGDQATKLKQKNIHYQLQVDLEEELRKKKTAALNTCQKIIMNSLRIIMGFVAFGLITAACFGIFVATVFSQERSGQNGILGLIFEYLPSMVITAGNFLVPLLCDQIALVERYPPSTTVILALLRAVFLRLVSLGVLLFTLWSQITCQRDMEKCSLCQYNHEEYPCWETRVGQEMYKLSLFDLIVTVAALALVEFPRRILVDNWSNKVAQWFGRQEFVVSANVLGLVYGQTVVWVGALFCPLLPVINAVKFIILFYCKKVTLFYNCRPALKTFRSTASTLVFLVVLLFGWAMSTLVLIYSVAEIRPSVGCGPFRFFPYMWAIVPTSFDRLSEVTQEFLFFVGSQAFSIPLFALSWSVEHRDVLLHRSGCCLR